MTETDSESPSLSLKSWSDLYGFGLSIGLRPNEFWSMTLFEFKSFAKGREYNDRMMWNHTSAVLSLIANTNRDSKKTPKPYTPNDFNPYSSNERTVRKITDQDKEMLLSWRNNLSSPLSSD